MKEVPRHMRKREPNGTPVDGYEVFRWPEFKALCERLGVEYSLPSSSITIRVAIGEPPIITQDYHGKDFNEPTPERIINTTNLHNETYETHSPRPAVPHPDKML